MGLTVRLLAVLVLGADGETAVDGGSPRKQALRQASEASLQGVVRTTLDHPEPTPEQRARRERSRARLAALGARVADTLPVIERARELRVRPAREVAGRAVAVGIAAAKGEGMKQQAVLELVKRFQAEALFTPQERAFIHTPAATEKDRLKFSWRYEGLDVLLWALGLKEALPPPDTIVDVPADVDLVKVGQAELVKRARLRSAEELLDANDLYYCLDWVAVEQSMTGQRNPLINPEIVFERHYALNWLIRYMNQAWDDITTDT